MRLHPNFTFESVVPPRSTETPAASSLPVLRDVAASLPFQSALAPVMAADTAAAPDLTDPPDAAAIFSEPDYVARLREYHFGSGPKPWRASSPPPDAAFRAFLKRSRLTQTMIDIGALAFGLFLAFVFTLAILGMVPAIGYLIFFWR